MLARAKKIAAVILAETTTPAACIAVPRDLRAALAGLAAELIEINQRLALLENGKGNPDGKI
jgi:hypothetical protein